MHMDMSEQPVFAFYPFYARIYRKNAAPEGLGARFVPACTSEMRMDMSDELCYARMPVRRTFCAILRNRKAHGHVTRAHLCKFRGEREREKSLHCTTAKSMAHRSPHRAEDDKDDKGVWWKEPKWNRISLVRQVLHTKRSHHGYGQTANHGDKVRRPRKEGQTGFNHIEPSKAGTGRKRAKHGPIGQFVGLPQQTSRSEQERGKQDAQGRSGDGKHTPKRHDGNDRERSTRAKCNQHEKDLYVASEHRGTQWQRRRW